MTGKRSHLLGDLGIRTVGLTNSHFYETGLPRKC